MIEVIEKKEWTKKEKRCYQRLMTLLLYWPSHGYQVLRVDLTSSLESDSLKLRNNHNRLRQKIEREFGFDRIEHFIIETSEGNGVLHCLWAWKPKSAFSDVKFFVPQKWLSLEWQRLHKAKIVYIKVYDSQDLFSRERVSRYLVSQYLLGHGSQIVRYSYSWKRTVGYPIAKLWEMFKIYHFEYLGMDIRQTIERWDRFIMGERLEGKEGYMPRITEMRHHL